MHVLYGVMPMTFWDVHLWGLLSLQDICSLLSHSRAHVQRSALKIVEAKHMNREAW